MASKGISILDGIVPILTLLIAYLIFTLFIQSSDKVQNTLCGTISLLVVDGKIDENELKKQQYTVADLMEQLREKDVFKVQDVKYAILEVNGNMNIIKNTDNINALPLNVVEDGSIVENNLKLLNLKIEQVEDILNKNNVKKEDLLIGTLDENSNFIYQLKQKENSNEVKK